MCRLKCILFLIIIYSEDVRLFLRLVKVGCFLLSVLVCRLSFGLVVVFVFLDMFGNLVFIRCLIIK